MSAAKLAAAIIVIVIAAGAAGYLAMNKTNTTTTPTTTTTTNTGGAAGAGQAAQGGKGHGHRGGGQGKAGGQGGQNETGASSQCLGPNGETPGQLINWLLDNHALFKYQLKEDPQNMTLEWIITGPNKQAMENLVNHIHQMECIIENGGNPRPHDPLFIVDAYETNHYVNTSIKWINDTAIMVVKKAENECAYKVIELHAQVVKGFFDTGRVEASKIHPIPEDVLEICKPYLNETILQEIQNLTTNTTSG